MTEHEDVLVIGLGHRDRADDGVGLALAEELRARQTAGTIVRSGPRDAAWILDAWRGRDCVVVLDCVRSGRPAGTVHRIDPAHGPFVDSASASTHGLGLASAVELGRALGDLPRRLVLVGIEGKSFEIGAPVSAGVRAALPRAVALVEQLVAGWHAGGSSVVSDA